MINEIIKEINEAEKHAVRIIEQANADVINIEKQNQIEIEELKTAYDEETRAFINKQTDELGEMQTDEVYGDILNVAKTKQDEATKYIVAQFTKKYVGGAR